VYKYGQSTRQLSRRHDTPKIRKLYNNNISRKKEIEIKDGNVDNEFFLI